MTEGAAVAVAVCSFAGAAGGAVVGALYGLHFVARRLPGIMFGAPQVTPVGNMNDLLQKTPGGELSNTYAAKLDNPPK